MWDWVFDGIGTELISLAVGALTGGIVGYRIGIRNRAKQTQDAGEDANQKQIFRAGVKSNQKNIKYNSRTIQSQKAGNRATQMQMGEFYDE